MVESVWFVAVALTEITGSTMITGVTGVVSMFVPSGLVFEPLSKIMGPLAVF